MRQPSSLRLQAPASVVALSGKLPDALQSLPKLKLDLNGIKTRPNLSKVASGFHCLVYSQKCFDHKRTDQKLLDGF